MEFFQCGFRRLFERLETPLVELCAPDSEDFEGGVAEDVDVFLEVPVPAVFTLVV
jgi:hypothetical protein